MRAEKNDTDYDVYLTTEEIHKIGDSRRTDKFEFETFFIDVTNSDPSAKPEVMMISGTRDSTVLFNKKTNDNIYFEMHENGPIVLVYPPVLSMVLERGFAVTRYDGHEGKIWIRRDDMPPPTISS